MVAKISGIPLVTDKSKQYLNGREEISYRQHRRELLTRLLDRGKNPSEGIGYVETTVKGRTYRLDMLYRSVWKAEGR